MKLKILIYLVIFLGLNFNINTHENIITSLRAKKNVLNITVNEKFKEKYLLDDFFIEYNRDIDLNQFNNSILIAPLILNIISIIWFSGDIYEIDSMDYDLYWSLKRIKKVFKRMYPNTPWNGRLIPKKIIHNAAPVQNNKTSAALFSHGLDSIYTSFKHIDKKQFLITAWGHFDTPLDDSTKWFDLKNKIEKFAGQYGHENSFIKSNYSSFLNRKILDKLTPQITSWRVEAVEGLGWAGMVTPILLAKGYNILLIPSTLSYSCPYLHAASPLIDENISCAGVTCIHDGWELTRADKCEWLALFCRKAGIEKQFIRVCQKDEGVNNCLHCVKCLQTIWGFIASGQDYKRFGFDIEIEELWEISEDFFTTRKIPRYNIWHFQVDQEKLHKFLAKNPERNNDYYQRFLNFDMETMHDKRDNPKILINWEDFKELLTQRLLKFLTFKLFKY